MSLIAAASKLTPPRTADGFETTATKSENIGGSTSGGIPDKVRHAYDDAAQHFNSNMSSRFTPPPPPVLTDSQARQLLDQAEKLAKDAFARASDPGATAAERLKAAQEMDAAHQYRRMAFPGRTAQEKAQIYDVDDLEQHALMLTQRAKSLPERLVVQSVGRAEMQVGSSISKQLDTELAPPFNIQIP